MCVFLFIGKYIIAIILHKLLCVRSIKNKKNKSLCFTFIIHSLRIILYVDLSLLLRSLFFSLMNVFLSFISRLATNFLSCG